MKLQKTLLIAAAIHLFALNSYAQNSRFKVSIWQNGEEKTISNNTVQLQKKEFDIVFHFYDNNRSIAVSVNASFNSKTYKVAKKGVALDKISCFESGRGMAEGIFNSEKNIMIADEVFNYWFYDNNKYHRFNSVTTRKDGIFATRTISKLNIDTHKDADWAMVKKPLYLVFFTYNTAKNSTQTEIQREYIKIKWDTKPSSKTAKKRNF